MIYSCVIIDDEPLAIDVLSRLVDKIPELALEATFQNPIEALSYINDEKNIDVLFLDINMPTLSGLDLPKLLDDSNVAVVFVSAYDEFALQSYEINAVDYLMKPVSIERLLKTMGKIKQRISQASGEGAGAQEEYVFVKTDMQTVKLKIADVLFFEGLKDYVNIRMKDGTRLVSRESLKFIHTKLSAHNFLRVHRSYVVNFAHIDRLDSKALVIGSHSIPIGSSYKEQLNELIRNNVIGDRSK